MDIAGIEPLLYAPPHILVLKKFQVSSFKFKVVLIPRAFPLFYYSLSNKLYERLCCNLLFVCLFYSYSLYLSTVVLLFGGE